MWKEYKETFDGVHASQRLKEEVLNMKREGNGTKRRRIPAAALVAAVLVVVLAGTAVAIEYLGCVTIVPMDQVMDERAPDTYAIYGNCDRIPVESLSDEVLAFAAETGTQDGMIMAAKDFASFAECELFLGLELADNPELEAQPWYEDGKPAASTVYVFSCQQMPASIRVDSIYEVDGYRINEYALLRTENDESTAAYDIAMSLSEGGVFEEYVTRSGMEVAIFTEESATGERIYSAYFTRNSALFMVSLLDGNAGTELDTLKEILDAYE